jgi:hypothetical protein
MSRSNEAPSLDVGDIRELAHRRSNGLDVKLSWLAGTELTIVSVEDNNTGSSFEVSVQPGQKPLDVFHHPFAYAVASEGAESQKAA